MSQSRSTKTKYGFILIQKVLQQRINTILSRQNYEIYRYQRWIYQRDSNLEGDLKAADFERKNNLLAYKHVENDPFDSNPVRQIPVVVTQMENNGQR